MTDQKQSTTLGIYWGRKSLYLTESIDLETKITATIPFTADSNSTEFSPFSSEGNDLVSNLSSTFKKNRINPGKIFLSLPTKDIIFRSFVIPWMQQNEIADVVDFEASKYIPFSLDELSYSFHSMSITEGNTKRIRIIFAAIKKSTLDTYTALLEQANIAVTNVEPSPISLIRCLAAKEMLATDKTLAIVEKEGLLGKITIVDQGVPLFVREFQLQLPSIDKESEPDTQAIITRLMNEIRISLDYFNRQESHLKVENIALIADPSETSDLKTKIENDLQLSTNPIDLTNILEGVESPHPEFLSAFGASYHDDGPSTITFDLIESAVEKPDKISFDIKDIDLKSINYKPIVATAVVCLAILSGLFFLKLKAINTTNEQITGLESQLGIYKTRTEDMIQQKTLATNEKIAKYKTLRTTGDITTLLTVIPDALPQNAWLSDLEFTYTEKKNASPKDDVENFNINTNLSGFIYTDDLAEHITIITQFIKNLNEVELIAKLYENIKVDSASQRRLSDYDVTFFKLNFVSK